VDVAVKIDLITFDAGNTLIRARPSLGEIYAGVTRRFGAEVAPDRFVAALQPAYRNHLRAHVGNGSDEADRRMWRDITREMFDSMPEVSGAVPFDDWFDGLYRAFGSSEAWDLFDGAEATLCELKFHGFRLGLVSNWDSRLRRIAEELGLLRYMHAVAISSEVGVRKPHPAIFESITRRLEIDPGRSLHVGDALEEDVRGAAAAGWHAVLLDRSGGHSAPPDGAYHVVRTLDELWPLLRGSDPGH
jgi:putative hydrolase of the HAD superfamily